MIAASGRLAHRGGRPPLPIGSSSAAVVAPLPLADEVDVGRQARQQNAGEVHHVRCVHVEIGRRALIAGAGVHEVHIRNVHHRVDDPEKTEARIVSDEDVQVFAGCDKSRSSSTPRQHYRIGRGVQLRSELLSVLHRSIRRSIPQHFVGGRERAVAVGAAVHPHGAQISVTDMWDEDAVESHQIACNSGHKGGNAKAVSIPGRELELENVAAEYQGSALEPSLLGFLEEVALQSDADLVDQAHGQVTLMTVHNAKGLEFDIVAMTGMEEGIFPHVRADDPESLEEERRLCYVGMTRARRRLVLTHAETRAIHGGREYRLPSRFLAEIPPDAVYAREGAPVREAFAEASRRSASVRLEAGDTVVHATFGEGVVTGVESRGSLVRVRFSRDGTERRLMAGAAPMRKVG